MQLQELIETTDELFYADSPSYKVILSKQKELLEIVKPETDINKIDNNTVNKIIKTYRVKGNTNNTINAKLAYLSKILTYAYRIGELKNKPYIPHFKVIEQKEKYLSKLEKHLILHWCWKKKHKELAKIILIGLYTGLRINNILSLTDKNYVEGVLQIYDKKVNKYFFMPVSPKIKYIIDKHKCFNLTYRQVYYLFSIMKKELNLDKAITIHTLRHTFCSELIQKGVSLPVIQALANHKKITTTMRYTHINNNQLTAAIDVL